MNGAVCRYSAAAPAARARSAHVAIKHARHAGSAVRRCHDDRADARGPARQRNRVRARAVQARGSGERAVDDRHERDRRPRGRPRRPPRCAGDRAAARRRMRCTRRARARRRPRLPRAGPPAPWSSGRRCWSWRLLRSDGPATHGGEDVEADLGALRRGVECGERGVPAGDVRGGGEPGADQFVAGRPRRPAHAARRRTGDGPAAVLDDGQSGCPREVGQPAADARVVALVLVPAQVPGVQVRRLGRPSVVTVAVVMSTSTR